MKNILHYLAWFIILGNLFLIGLVIFWLLYPYRLPYIEQPIQINNPDKKVAINQTINMTLRVSKPVDIVAISQPNIICNDGNLVTLSNNSRTLPKGEYIIEVNSYILPSKVSVGVVCKFNFVNTYTLNPIRSQTVVWSSEQFTVIPAVK